MLKDLIKCRDKFRVKGLVINGNWTNFYMPLLCQNNNMIKKSDMRIGLKPIISELY
jgi:hypothetical protein